MHPAAHSSSLLTRFVSLGTLTSFHLEAISYNYYLPSSPKDGKRYHSISDYWPLPSQRTYDQKETEHHDSDFPRRKISSLFISIQNQGTSLQNHAGTFSAEKRQPTTDRNTQAHTCQTRSLCPSHQATNTRFSSYRMYEKKKRELKALGR